MIRIVKIMIIAATVAGFTSCHDTIHIHPLEDEPAADEEVMLTLTVDNGAPRLGAIIDYTIAPAVIIYSDDLPENILPHVNKRKSGDDGSRSDNTIVQRAHALAEAFDRIAPYDLDGDKWDMHIKYEVYSGTIDQVASGKLRPIYSDDVVYRADTHRPACEARLAVKPGDMTVVAVAHIVPSGTAGDWFFNTSTLYNLYCNNDRRQGEFDNVYRDCFVVGKQFYVGSGGTEGEEQHFTATLTRPQGRYMTIADDYDAYLQFAATGLDDVMSHIHYPSYINVAYSVLGRVPLASLYDFGYEYVPTLLYVDDKAYVRLGDDWSFVNGERSNFNIDIAVYDKLGGQIINYNPNILVPIFPGRVTLVVGQWFTDISEGGGGIGVDPDFTDEIVIHF